LCVTRDIIPTDQLIPEARFTGYRLIPRTSQLHTLNITAALEKAAEELGISFDEFAAIGIQVGGGISLAGLLDGSYGDIANAGGETWSVERAGGMNNHALGMYIAENGLTPEQVSAMIMKGGGLASYLGTEDMKEIYEIIDDEDAARKHFLAHRELFTSIFGQQDDDDHVYMLQRFARTAVDSMQYQILGHVGRLTYSLFEGRDVDCVVLTGGVIKSYIFRTEMLNRLIGACEPADVRAYPGQFEMEALRDGAARALENNGLVQSYEGSLSHGWQQMLKSL
jgi:butyrate kinase